MFKSLYIFLTICLSVLLFSCQSALHQEVPESSENSHYKDLAKMSPDSLSYDLLYDRALGLWDVPFEEKDCDTQFGKGHVLIAGPEDAPPLVLLHGMNASSTSWYPNIAAFSATHRVYAIDFILEVNKSKLTQELTGNSDILKWYDEMFACLGLKKFEIAGASRGGWLAAQIAMNDPKRITKLVLLSPAQTFVWIPPSKKMLTNMMYTLSPSRDDLREALSALSNDVDKINQLYIDQYYMATTESELDGSVLEMTPIDKDEMSKLTMPVLVMIGDNDFANNEKSLKIADKNIPNVETVLLKNAGHFISIDQAEKVNQEVMQFLDDKE